jgi:1-acyl-sn-glycerol-3-phosphate acyltransferase
MWMVAVLGLAVGIGWVRFVRSGWTWGRWFGLNLARVYTALWHRWRSNGPAPFPDRGPALIVSNHTCSADPTFILAGSKRVCGFVVAREHYNISRPTRWLLDWMRCVPVTRGGKDAGAVRAVLRRLADGWIIGVFPEGNLSGVIHDRLRPGKPGIAYLALRSRVPVFPVYIAGGPRTEKLVYSWLVPAKKPVRVVYGRAVDLSAYYDRPLTRALLEEVTELLMARIAALRPRPGQSVFPEKK